MSTKNDIRKTAETPAVQYYYGLKPRPNMDGTANPHVKMVESLLENEKKYQDSYQEVASDKKFAKYHAKYGKITEDILKGNISQIEKMSAKDIEKDRKDLEKSYNEHVKRFKELDDEYVKLVSKKDTLTNGYKFGGNDVPAELLKKWYGTSDKNILDKKKETLIIRYDIELQYLKEQKDAVGAKRDIAKKLLEKVEDALLIVESSKKQTFAAYCQAAHYKSKSNFNYQASLTAKSSGYEVFRDRINDAIEKYEKHNKQKYLGPIAKLKNYMDSLDNADISDNQRFDRLVGAVVNNLKTMYQEHTGKEWKPNSNIDSANSRLIQDLLGVLNDYRIDKSQRESIAKDTSQLPDLGSLPRLEEFKSRFD